MTKQPASNRYIISSNCGLSSTFTTLSLAPPHTGVAANDDDEVPSRQSHVPYRLGGEDDACTVPISGYLAFFWLEDLIYTYIVGICGIAVIIEIAETQKTDQDAE